MARRRLPRDSQGRRPSVLMKIDIEGSEVEVFEDLIETGSLFRVDGIMAEFHEFNTPSEERRGHMTELRERLGRRAQSNIYSLPKKRSISLSFLCVCFRISNETTGFDFQVMDDETYYKMAPRKGMPKC